MSDGGVLPWVETGEPSVGVRGEHVFAQP
jgi:hypothetical protein